ncbi:hypothetical protein AVEN_63712-1 [Araneus ventricosus]|uniref:EF-hand domain-containing protein n=1 Tax=Araneus ventricosus TaxID=182803 RepID=A0A4Y2L7N5_ARAVE|nr:hypothetical protein AVEN_63712-1 [Araneus ventricosus]
MGGKSSKKPPKDLRPAFDIYIDKVGKDGCLTRSGFKKWLNEAFIIGEDSEVTVVEIEEVLAANIGERNDLNFDQFKKCIDDLVKEKKLDGTQLIGQLISAAKAHDDTR